MFLSIPVSKNDSTTLSNYLSKFELTEHSVHPDLGLGTSCVLTPKVLPSGELLLEIKVTEKKANGVIKSHTCRIQTKSGIPSAISTSQFGLSLTPVLKGQD